MLHTLRLKSFTTALLLILTSSPLLAQQSTTFYAGGHEDDWQLFETPNAINDVRNGQNKTVFIYMTAGDAGCGTQCPSPVGNVPYYLGRENGALRSVRFAATLDGPVTSSSNSTVVFNQHKIVRHVFGRTVSYFFRLPDGNNVDGTGFPGTGHQSLLLLHNGQISSLKAIDGSATYTSWSDLVATLTALITFEAHGSSDVWINAQDPDSTTNPGDHPDHYQTGMVMQEAAVNLPCINEAFYVGYSKANLPANLQGLDAFLQSAVFSIIAEGIGDGGDQESFIADSNYLGRTYSRVVPGNGGCSF